MMDAISAWDIMVSITPYLLCVIAFFILIEQITYLKKKKSSPGPAFILPFLGNVIQLMKHPARFWENEAKAAKESHFGFSTNYIIGKFTVFIQNTELSRKVFANVRPDAFHLVGHPFGKKLFGEHNLVYMSGQEHKDLRRRIAPNFSRNALSTYTSLQQNIILQHMKKWEGLSIQNGSKPIALGFLCRDMNLDTSQAVFVGPYLNGKPREEFNRDYNLVNIGMMSLPVDLSGFAFRKARLAVTRLIKTLGDCVQQSKRRIRSGQEPVCLVDFWMQELLKETQESVSDADEMPRPHPEILSKIRQEVSGIWSPESDTLITSENLRAMKYTEAVAKEILRYRNPATLVPHVAGEDFQLTESYTIPKGSIVFPSIFESSFQGFTDPECFDPDRFSEDRQEDRLFQRNFLVFGAGPHQCVGQRYAVDHLVLFIVMFTSLLDFKRCRTDGCDDISYVPTTCPKDDCMVYLSRRCTRYSHKVELRSHENVGA
ncbi:hypothetical protein MKW98_030179 [Papaver atlanticum]|uniref:sterol 22-desaturase n=1 Tax=Papaver atlanticum TaxID=357466 RepID=A0AAD4ST31_9MAGN|nr:hypothetical protein MKW98_030179 [Papaver atlanticum]